MGENVNFELRKLMDKYLNLSAELKNEKKEAIQTADADWENTCDAMLYAAYLKSLEEDYAAYLKSLEEENQ